jgi:alkylresorcinol/alkylpyrone synthase
VDRLISHAGGRDVLAAIRTRLPAHPLAEAQEVLRTRGNVSSPSVLMALERALQDTAHDERHWWLVSFGAGFSAHGCLMERN